MTKKVSKKVEKKSKNPSTKKAAKMGSKSRKETAKIQVRMTRSKVRASKAAVESKKKNPHLKEKVLGHAPHSSRITAPKGPIQPEASKTFFIQENSPHRQWLLVDVSGQTVGRAASEIAKLLRGKHKPSFTPNNDAGDFVVVINAEKVKFSGSKEKEKKYYDYSGYIGGMKEKTAEKLRAKAPEQILWRAVKGMIPRTPLGRRQMSKLKVYVGEKHPHAAQNPLLYKLNFSSSVKE